LGLPKVCPGLDKKEWDLISKMMKFKFQNTDITIRIYKLESEHKIECKSIATTPETSDSSTINIIIHSHDTENNQDTSIDSNLRIQINKLASYLEIAEQTPTDVDCGANALKVCLKTKDYT